MSTKIVLNIFMSIKSVYMMIISFIALPYLFYNVTI